MSDVPFANLCCHAGECADQFVPLLTQSVQQRLKTLAELAIRHGVLIDVLTGARLDSRERILQIAADGQRIGKAR